MKHQRIDLMPWRDNCLICESGAVLDIHFQYSLDKAAMVANRWIRKLVSGN